MGSDDEFGPDTETIRAWLSKRASYADDARVVGASRDDAATPDTPREPEPPNGIDAGRSVLAALGVDTPEAQPATTREVPDEVPGADPETHEVRPATAPQHLPAPVEVTVGRWTEPVDNLLAAHASTDVDFPVRAGVRRTLAVILLCVLATTAMASYLAWREPTTATIGGAVLLGLLTLVVWGARAGATTTALSIRRGQLSVRRGGRTEVVELSSHFTPIAILGEPGQRRWRVLIERPGLPLIVITPAMVDSHWFTTALYRVRPDLRPEAQAALREAAEHADPDGYDVSGLS